MKKIKMCTVFISVLSFIFISINMAQISFRNLQRNDNYAIFQHYCGFNHPNYISNPENSSLIFSIYSFNGSRIKVNGNFLSLEESLSTEHRFNKLFDIPDFNKPDAIKTIEFHQILYDLNKITLQQMIQISKKLRFNVS